MNSLLCDFLEELVQSVPFFFSESGDGLGSVFLYCLIRSMFFSLAAHFVWCAQVCVVVGRKLFLGEWWTGEATSSMWYHIIRTRANALV